MFGGYLTNISKLTKMCGFKNNVLNLNESIKIKKYNGVELVLLDKKVDVLETQLKDGMFLIQLRPPKGMYPLPVTESSEDAFLVAYDFSVSPMGSVFTDAPKYKTGETSVADLFADCTIFDYSEPTNPETVALRQELESQTDDISFIILFRLKPMVSQNIPTPVDVLRRFFDISPDPSSSVNTLTIKNGPLSLFGIKWILDPNRAEIIEREHAIFSRNTLPGNLFEDPAIDAASGSPNLFVTPSQPLFSDSPTTSRPDFQKLDERVVDLAKSEQHGVIMFRERSFSTPKAAYKSLMSPLHETHSPLVDGRLGSYTGPNMSDVVHYIVNTGIKLSDIGITREQFEQEDGHWLVEKSHYYRELFKFASELPTVLTDYDTEINVIVSATCSSVSDAKLTSNQFYLPSTADGQLNFPGYMYGYTRKPKNEFDGEKIIAEKTKLLTLPMYTLARV